VIAWEAPQECPGADAVRAAVWATTGSDRPSRAHADVTARAVVTANPAGGFTMRLAIETDGASETKTVDASSCGTLADAYAVIVAFRFDPEAVGRAAAPVHVVPVAVAPASVAPEEPSVSRRPFHLGAGPVVATGMGALPFPAYGIGGAVEAEYGLRWALAATYWPPQTAWAKVASPLGSHAYGAAVQLASVEPSACVAVFRRVLGLCGGVEVGAMSASGRGPGLVRSSGGASLWLSFTGGVEFELPAASFMAVRVRLDAGIPAFPPSFTIDNAGSTPSALAYRPAPVFALLRLEPLFRLFTTDSGEARHNRP
jgi:hypothetical protein